jgi:peptidoglycan/LPS O-acetylase OafA/YrhL
MKLERLTALRFLVALSIVLGHLVLMFKPLFGYVFYSFIGTLDTAVSFFFLLSGFILTYSWQQKNNPSWVDFFRNRFSRIFPIYFLALALTFAVRYVQDGQFFSIFSKTIFYVATLLQSWNPAQTLVLNPPAWTLSVEVFLYLLFPFAYFILRKRSLPLLAAINIVLWLSTLLWFQIINPYDRVFSRYFPPSHLSTFILGMSAGFLFVRYRASLELRSTVIGIVTIILLATFTLALALRVPFVIDHHPAILNPFYAGVVLFFALRSDKKSIFAYRPLQLLGESAYEIYIFQAPLAAAWFLIFNPHSGSIFVSCAGYVLTLISISVLIYLYVDLPVQRKFRRT